MSARVGMNRLHMAEEVRARVKHYTSTEPSARLVAEVVEERFPRDMGTVALSWAETIIAEVLKQLGYTPYPAVPKPTPAKR